ncbi:ABC transporter permease subunit [Epidermidibacterium keratini]|uniref:ABC transporter permease subunit n=1 Tax=Epidermidibacterium keratini TaxID=1891644 RepID=A0A7L4YT89_9ACTN|nr:ABC transporter permease subunit [Epidermidibacterium keratini]
MGLGVLAVLIVLAGWQLLSVTGVLNEQAVPSAVQVAAAMLTLLGTSTFWASMWATLASALAGLAILTGIAVVIAALVTRSKFLYESTWFIFEFLKPIPPIALIPLGLLLWGPSPTMKITLITFGALWPLLTQLIYASRAIDGVSLDVARSYRLGLARTARYVVLPSVLPYALTGLRISASIAIIISVVTEMVGGAAGIGQDIIVAQSANDLPTMYGLIMMTGILGLLINVIFALASRSLLFWHPSQREDLR